MIQAIQTAAFGRLFRSRLEARVACFLEHLGARWEYEPQGFGLPSGRYLPDFRVYYHDLRANRPNQWFWLECKASDPTDKEVLLARELSNATKSLVMFFTSNTFDELRHHYFRMGEVYEYLGHEKTGDCDSMLYKDPALQYWGRPSVIDKQANSLLSWDLQPNWNWVQAFHAANAALSQRFEFGEAPA